MSAKDITFTSETINFSLVTLNESLKNYFSFYAVL